MSKGSTLRRMVKRAKGFRVSSQKEKLQVAYRVLRDISKGNSEEAKLALATLMVLGE